MSGFSDTLFACCAEQAAAVSLTFFNEHHVDICFSGHWPAAEIKKSLAVNLATPHPSAFRIHCLTTDAFDVLPAIARFPRDRHGQLGGLPLAFYDATNHMLRVYDFANRRAAYIAAADRAFPEWEVHSPLREFWHLWALHHDALMIHSGVISQNGRAALLPGAGGKGKSTTVLSCLQQGMQTTGDDYNLIRRTAQGYIAAPLYGNVKLKRQTQSPFALPMMTSWPQQQLSYAGKNIYYPPDDVWDRTLPGIAGIIVPEVPAAVQQEPMLHPLKPAALINSLAMSSIMQSPFMAKEYLQRLVAFTQSLPATALRLSVNPEANAALIRHWLTSGAADEIDQRHYSRA